MTRRWVILGRLLAAVMGVVLGPLVILYLISVARQHRRYLVPDDVLTLPTDSASLAYGGHLVTAVAACTSCHGGDLGGMVAFDQPLLGRFVAPNLTRGAGGVAPRDSDQDLARAIRHGVGRNGRPLLFMPSDAYRGLSDRDIAAIVAYLRKAPPVDRHLPHSRIAPLGRALHVLGFPVISAEKIDHRARVVTPPPGVDVSYGRHLATVAGCRGCHGTTLGGGAGPGPDLTAGALAGWTETDFGRALRQGRRPDGSMIQESMPWSNYAKLTDEEVGALWLYVRSLTSTS
jgi:cytochrome c553